MKILAFTTVWWNSREEAERLKHGPLGLVAWADRVAYLFNPVHAFLACGTFSDPAFSPLAESIAVINSGVESTEAYNVWYRQYWCCAMTAAAAYALNRRDWEFLVLLNHDVLVGAVDFKSLFAEFQKRPEVILTNRWADLPGGPFIAWKRKGVAMFLHERRRANIVHEAWPQPVLSEQEMGEIYKGVWWDAWPEVDDVRQDFSVNPNDPNPMRSLHWPFISQPHPDVIGEYLRTQWVKARPV